MLHMIILHLPHLHLPGSSYPSKSVNKTLLDECSTLDDYSTVTTNSRSVNTRTLDRCGALYDLFVVISASTIIRNTNSMDRYDASIECLAAPLL